MFGTRRPLVSKFIRRVGRPRKGWITRPQPSNLPLQPKPFLQAVQETYGNVWGWGGAMGGGMLTAGRGGGRQGPFFVKTEEADTWKAEDRETNSGRPLNKQRKTAKQTAEDR
jgi:hypothetical protein